MNKIFFVAMFLLTHALAYSGEIAITFDDVPRGDGHQFTGEERTATLIKGLAQYNIQAAFFCNTQNFDPSGIKRVESYSTAGHFIANHSHSHPDLNDVTSEAFIKDVQKADKTLALIPNFQKWFRFPFLREGKTFQQRDEVRLFLSTSHYQNGYVTVDNSDWYMEALYQNAMREKKNINYEKLGQLYVNILWDAILFFDRMAIKTLGRSPKHVLLLHENDLAALFIPKLIQKIQQTGWKLISPVEAYKDPIASMEPYILFADQGRVAAIAKERGHPGPFQSKWENQLELEKAFAEAKVFE